MNKLLLIFMLSLTGCGMAEDLSSRCPSNDARPLCELMFGKEDVNQNEELNNLKRRMTDLEADFNSLSYSIDIMSNEVVSLSVLTESLQFQMDQMIILNATGEYNLHQQIDNLSSQINNNNISLTNIITQLNITQNNLNELVIEVAELAGHNNIVDIIDPCGDWSNGFDEVILRTSDGKLLAYFENGSNRYLSLLVPGSYRTTDGSNCNFTVNNSKQVCSNSGCE